MKGTLILTTFMSSEICIYLPPSYDMHEEHFPVVYLQDGGYLFRDCLSELEEMMITKELQGCIFVGIKPDNRNDEYSPWFAKAVTAGFSDFGGQGARYLAFLVKELKPYIDEKYRTMRNPENTAIAGASFGGLISMYAAYLYPEVFGRIASISGSFWYAGFIEFMRSADIVHFGRRIYMDVGSLEGTRKDNEQRNMVAKNQEAYAILLDKGFSQNHCQFVTHEGEDHGHSFFLKRFPTALQWLFPIKMTSFSRR